nr:hypothetical protein [uncultured Acetobacteroides sp.]
MFKAKRIVSLIKGVVFANEVIDFKSFTWYEMSSFPKHSSAKEFEIDSMLLKSKITLLPFLRSDMNDSRIIAPKFLVDKFVLKIENCTRFSIIIIL